jgi:hypothetical protein
MHYATMIDLLDKAKQAGCDRTEWVAGQLLE